MATANHSAYRNVFSSAAPARRASGIGGSPRSVKNEQAIDHYKATLAVAINEHSHALATARDTAKFSHERTTQKTANRQASFELSSKHAHEGTMQSGKQMHEAGQAGLQRSYGFNMQATKHEHEASMQGARLADVSEGRAHAFAMQDSANTHAAGQAGLGRSHAFGMAAQAGKIELAGKRIDLKDKMEGHASKERISMAQNNHQRERNGQLREAVASHNERVDLASAGGGRLDVYKGPSTAPATPALAAPKAPKTRKPKVV